MLLVVTNKLGQQTSASLSSLVEILEDKGIITQTEWERRIKEKVTID